LLQQQSLSQKQLLKAHRIDHALQEYFDTYPEQRTATPCEVMPMLLKKGIFYKPDRRKAVVVFSLQNGKDGFYSFAQTSNSQTADKNWYFEKSKNFTLSTICLTNFFLACVVPKAYLNVFIIIFHSETYLGMVSGRIILN
jgi:hypothetical protein